MIDNAVTENFTGVQIFLEGKLLTNGNNTVDLNTDTDTNMGGTMAPLKKI